jgi:hypothetical protein
MRQIILVAAMVLVSACAGPEDPIPTPGAPTEGELWADVYTRLDMSGPGVACVDPWSQWWNPPGGTGGPDYDPALASNGYCVFERVSWDGVNKCRVLVDFTRPDIASAWAVLRIWSGDRPGDAAAGCP